MKKCSKCGAEYEGNFCPACGAQYEEATTAKFCPKCGKPVGAGQRFCASCGYSFEAAQTPAQPAPQPAAPAQPAYAQPAPQPVQPVYVAPAPVAEDDKTYPSKFTGGVFMLAAYEWAVILGTIFTFGFCYPFLMCWKMRWETEHTIINGRKLVFDGKGGDLFKHYVIWLLLSFVTLGIYFVLKGQINIIGWQTKHTHFEGVEVSYDEDGEPAKADGSAKEVVESKFDGKWYQLLGVNWLTTFITLITLSFGMYWAHCYKQRWWCKHKTIDNHALYFDGKAGQYFGQRIKWTLLTIITFGIYSFWLHLKSVQWTAKHTHVENPASLPSPDGVKPVNGAPAANAAAGQPAAYANGQPPYQVPPAQPANTNSGSNGLAIAGMILALIPSFCFIGLILSIVGLVQSKKYGGNGKGLAIAGIVIGSLWIVVVAIIYIVVIGMSIGSNSFMALAALAAL